MPSFFLGIDVSKASFHAALLHEEHFEQASFSNDEKGRSALKRWLDSLHVSFEALAVTLEATGCYSQPLADWMVALGWQVFVLNPKRFHKYALSGSFRPKTDAADARLMAFYLSTHHSWLRPYQPAPATLQGLREMTRRRAQLVEERTRVLNRMEALPAQSPAHASQDRHLVFLREELERLDAELEEWVSADESLCDSVRRVRQIPQVGKVLACVLVAELGDANRFERAKSVTAWAGLAPREVSSGSSVRKEARISRGTQSYLRSVLYMGAQGGLRAGSFWQPWLQPRQENGKTGKKLIVALMDKILRLAWALLRSGNDFDPKRALAT